MSSDDDDQQPLYPCRRGSRGASSAGGYPNRRESEFNYEMLKRNVVAWLRIASASELVGCERETGGWRRREWTA